MTYLTVTVEADTVVVVSDIETDVTVVNCPGKEVVDV
jgi:hypothetical protein